METYADSKELIASNLLSESDAEFIDTHIGMIRSNWEKQQMFRTETEMRVSVLNDIKFPTIASKYWQAVREQAAFYGNLIQNSFQYRENALEIVKYERKLEELEKANPAHVKNLDLKIVKTEIKLEKLRYSEIHIKKEAFHRMREIKQWALIMAECVEADPTFDIGDVNKHQLVSYTHRWLRQAEQMEVSGASPSERWNLHGQLESGQRALHEQGIKLEKPKTLSSAKRPTLVGSGEAAQISFGNVSFEIKAEDAVPR